MNGSHRNLPPSPATPVGDSIVATGIVRSHVLRRSNALVRAAALGRDTRRTMEAHCPCGSGMTYAACCRQVHSGAATARTALELMRSRYSAFAVHDAGYLLATWHPATRPASVDLDPAIEWRRLKILGLTGGSENGDSGTVEFIAHYWDSTRSQYGRQHENSRFARQDRHWFYVEPAP